MISTSPKAARFAMAIFTLALCINTGSRLVRADAQFTYRHGFISALFATGARTFAQNGIMALGGVPVANNPPLGPNDAYPHWPPMLPVSLSLWYRLFGASEFVGHLWMLVVQTAAALLVCAIARQWLGKTAGPLAGVFWLTLPVVVDYGQLILAESIAISLMLASALCFLRLRVWLTAIFAFLAVSASWEAVLLVPAFWGAAFASRQSTHRRIALAGTAAGAFALLLIFGCYFVHNPKLFADTIHTGLFRMGLAKSYSQAVIVESCERYVGVEESISRILVHFPRMLGLFGAPALVLLALSRPPGSPVIVCLLGSPWLLWCILMRNHVAVHDLEMGLAAPLAAVALAWMAMGFFDKMKDPKGIAIAIALSLAILAQPWILGTESSPENPQQILGFSEGIRTATDSSAVVLSPLVSAIPLYYSERHIIRCIPDESTLTHVLPYVRSQYPNSRLYWATPLYAKPWVSVKEIR